MQYQTNYPYATTSQQYGVSSHPREDQRRRQQEYSQALAQQVAQRDLQKRREREMEHHHGRNNFQSQPPFEQSRHGAFEPAERDIFDGLGRNNYQNSRTNFARGQPQLHHRLPGGPESTTYPQAGEFPPTRVSHSGHQPPIDNQSFHGNSVGPNHHHPVPQQSWQQQPAHDPSGLGPSIPTGWPSQQNSMSQARTSQFWPGQTIAEQAASPPVYGGYGSPQRAAQQNLQQGFPQAEPVHNGGRRQRTDIHDGGRGDSEEAERFQRKLQQQQEMQLALERQIEEKRQQKLESKRRQEEEDRREMERFEEDKRRQRAEEERLQEEKRRKAALEQQKAEQAAAAVAAANQQAKLQQQQKLHAQTSQAMHPQLAQPFQHQPFPAQPQQPEHFSNAPSPSKNPFTNSRAHLFEDPPPQRSPQRAPMVPNNHFGYSNQNASPMRAGPQGFGQIFPQENNAVGRSLDATDLRRQYDDMREELRRQKQLVDQLRQAQAQIQHQQQQQQQLSPKRSESGNIPTLMDLEKLRNELRGELAYREQIHRQELESFKREQQQERSPAHSPLRYHGVKNSFGLPTRVVPNNVEQVAPHPVTTTATFEILQQSTSPVKPGRNSQSIERLPRLPLDESLMSLHGESKFVYFDGRVAEADKARNAVVAQATNGSKVEGIRDALDEQSELVKVESPKARRSLRLSPTKQHGVKKPLAAMSSPSLVRKRVSLIDAGTDRVDESHDFVVTGIPPSPLHKQHQHLISSLTFHPSRAAASSHRYSQIPSVLSSPSPTKGSGKWRLESMSTNDTSDSDDDLDVSLDGEQLEALFQRNVRRHEILLGFQTKVQAQVQDSKQQQDGRAPHVKLAWAELRQQLESNRLTSTRTQGRKLSTTSTDSNDSNLERQDTAEDEAALVASSQWMPSSLFLPTEHSRSRNK